jgi:hypothetical protein
MFQMGALIQNEGKPRGVTAASSDLGLILLLNSTARRRCQQHRQTGAKQRIRAIDATAGRQSPPWSVEELEGCFVRDTMGSNLRVLLGQVLTISLDL